MLFLWTNLLKWAKIKVMFIDMKYEAGLWAGRQ